MGTLMYQISGSMKTTPQSSLQPGEVSEKMVICETGSGLSPHTEIVGALIMDLPTSRTERNKFLFFKPLSLQYSVIGN